MYSLTIINRNAVGSSYVINTKSTLFIIPGPKSILFIIPGPKSTLFIIPGPKSQAIG